MNLIDVYTYDSAKADALLYELLAERTPGESISHKRMPTPEEHHDFVDDRPYLAWYFIEAEGKIRGACYLSKQREIGVFLFKRYTKQGVGALAVRMLMAKHPGKFLANCNPGNIASAKLFEAMGFRHIQNTFELEPA